MADAHHRPRPRGAVARGEMAGFRREIETLAIALRQTLVVVAKDLVIDKLRFLNDAVQARVLRGEVEKRLQTATLGGHAIFDADQRFGGVLAQGVADIVDQGEKNFILGI